MTREKQLGVVQSLLSCAEFLLQDAKVPRHILDFVHDAKEALRFHQMASRPSVPEGAFLTKVREALHNKAIDKRIDECCEGHPFTTRTQPKSTWLIRDKATMLFGVGGLAWIKDAREATHYSDGQRARTHLPPSSEWVRVDHIDPPAEPNQPMWRIRRVNMLLGYYGYLKENGYWTTAVHEARCFTEAERMMTTLPPKGEWVRFGK